MGTKENRTLVILHIAVLLAGWTGLFGRLISLGGLPLVWYRMMVSVVVLALVMALMGRLHRMPWKSFVKIAACGFLLSLHWVAFYASIQASNVSIGVACIATSCFFTTLLDPLINRKRLSWPEVLISFIAIRLFAVMLSSLLTNASRSFQGSTPSIAWAILVPKSLSTITIIWKPSQTRTLPVASFAPT